MGLAADYVPEVYDAAHLGQGLPAVGRVLILRAEIGSPALTEALRRRNISYDDVSVYRTVYRSEHSQSLREALEAGALPYATFTSASTVKGFVSTVGEGADFSRMVGLCIGEQTAAEARKHGIAVKVAARATIGALVGPTRRARLRRNSDVSFGCGGPCGQLALLFGFPKSPFAVAKRERVDAAR